MKSTRLHHLLGLLAIAGCAFAFTQAAADDMPPPPGHGVPMPHFPPPSDMGPRPPFLHGIRLTDTQDDAVFELLTRDAIAIRKQCKEVERTGRELHEQSLGDNFSEARIAELVQAHAQAEAKLAMMRIKQDRAVLALLTAEQRQQVRRGAGHPDGPPMDMPGHGER